MDNNILNDVCMCFKMNVDLEGLKKLEQTFTNLEKENKQLKEQLSKEKEIRQKAIEYIKKYQQIYDIDGSVENMLDEFNVLASPKKILEILESR